jgi:hypothetical protein
MVSSNVLLSTSWSNETRGCSNHPGGTDCLILNLETGYNTEIITDKRVFGRWSEFKLKDKTQTSIIVLNAYRPTDLRDVSDYT